MQLRDGIWLLSLALGVAVFRVAPVLPPWTGSGGRIELVAALAERPSFWATAFVAFLLGWLTLTIASRLGSPARQVAADLLPGPSVAVLAIVIDPLSHRTTAPLLMAFGCALALVAAVARNGAAISSAVERFFPEDLPNTRKRRLRAAAGIFGLAFLVVGAAGPWGPLNGDEPHYYVLARSLVEDLDLDLADDYTPGRRPWLLPESAPAHTTSGARPGSAYSFHGPGLGFALAPAVAVARLLPPGVDVSWLRATSALWALLAGVCLYGLLSRYVNRPRALAGAALIVSTAPILLQAPHLFPDLPAMALSAGAWWLVLAGGRRARIAAAAALAVLPWLHFKFLALFVVELVACSWVLRREQGVSSGPRVTFAAIALAGPAGLSIANFLLFGSASPLAAAAFTEVEGVRLTLLDHLTDPFGAIRTGLALLIDQKDGLLFHAPHYLLAIPGAVWLCREQRARTIALLAMFAAIWAPAALSQNSGLWSPPTRWLVGGLWPLALMAALGAVRPWSDRRLRFARRVLIAGGGLMTLASAAGGATFYVDRADTRSPLLAWLGGPGLPLWKAFPLWTRFEEGAWPATILWSVVVLVLGIWLARWASSSLASPTYGRTSDRFRSRADRVPFWAVPFVDPVRRLGSGAIGAAFAVILAGVTVLASIMFVPADDPAVTTFREYGPIRVETSRLRPPGAWLHSGSVWFPGARRGRVTVSSEEPLNSLELLAEAPASMEVDIRLGNGRTRLRLEERLSAAPGSPAGRGHPLGRPLVLPARGGLGRRRTRHGAVRAGRSAVARSGAVAGSGWTRGAGGTRLGALSSRTGGERLCEAHESSSAR